MLIDDDCTSINDSRSFFKNNTSYEVSWAQSIEEASVLLKEYTYDTIVSEQNLPDGDGLSFLKKIRSDGDRTPFIFFTSECGAEFIRDALNNGANFFSTKKKSTSDTFYELSRMIRSCCEVNRNDRNLKQYHEVIENIDIAVLAFRLDDAAGLRLVDMNRAATRIVEWDDSVCSSLKDSITHLDDRSTFEHSCSQHPSIKNDHLECLQFIDAKGAQREYSIDVMRVTDCLWGVTMRDVTAEMHVLRNLAEREKTFRLIIENTGDNITLLDFDLNVSFTNSSIKKLRGFTVEEASKQNIQDVLTPDSLQKVKTILKEQMELEVHGAVPDRTVITELEEYHKDGSIVLVENSFSFYRDAEMQPKGVISISRDIGEKRRREDKLRHSYDLLDYIISHTRSGIAVHDRDLKYIYVSERFLKEYGLTGQNIIGRHLYEVFTDLPEKWKDVHRRALNGEVSRADEDFYQREDGSTIWARWECRPWYESDEEVGGLIIYSEVINDQMEREIALEESRTQLKQIIEDLPDATMVISKDGIVTHWNKSMKALTGIRSEDIVGQGDYAYSIPFYGERRPVLADVVRGAWTNHGSSYDRLRNEGDVLTVDASPVLSHGRKIIVWANARPLYDTQGNIIGAIQSIRDVTEMVQVTQRLQHMNNQLNLMSHLARHDTLNQIMVIDGYLELMRDMIDDPEILKLFKRLEFSASKIREHIEFTHIYHDIGSQEPVWQRLTESVPDNSDIPNIILHADIGGLEIYADPMLKKVFSNLLDNSLRHGGHVSEIKISYLQTSEGLLIIWEDNGRGVPTDFKTRIFERGYGSNTGLGLFLITEILNITKIKIRENGEPGKGARFEIGVPLENYRLVQSS